MAFKFVVVAMVAALLAAAPLCEAATQVSMSPEDHTCDTSGLTYCKVGELCTRPVPRAPIPPVQEGFIA
jgi:hypothetical protein